MRSINTLKKHLTQAVDALSGHRIDLLSRFIRTLLVIRSVNLMKIATAMAGPAKKMSRYRRLQRFFSSGLSPAVLTPLLVKQVVRPGKQLFVRLAIDRTHWKWGQTDLNVLCLGLCHHGVSIPIESVSLGKAGNSNTKERKKMIRTAWRYLKAYPCTLLADREFIGAEWFTFLLGVRGLEFIIRIPCAGWLTLPNGRQHYLSQLVRTLRKGQTRTYENVLLYDKSDTVRLNLVCHRSQKGELVLLATNRSALEESLSVYKSRWSIETAFGFLKSKGFELEETHLTKPKRLQLLMGVLALTLLWGLLVGLDVEAKKPIVLKKHGRKTISWVRLGLDHLQEAILNIDDQWKAFRYYCRLLLSCT